jgi:hypothetical protein
MTVDIEDFIAVKGFKALGNQLTTEVKQVNMLDPLPYEVPEEFLNAESQMMMVLMFNSMKTDKSTYFNFLDIKKLHGLFYILIYFISFRGFHIDDFYHQ